MASRRRETVAGASNGLSVEAAHHYARIYVAARAGCLSELRRAGCGEEEAEDIFAATLERIMRKLDPPGEGFGAAQTVALLKQACRQKLIDERRHRDALRMVPLKEALARCDLTSQSAAEAAEDREAVAIGREAISSLPERDRRIFLQRHRLGLSPEEILIRNPGLSSRTYRKVMQRANARALAAFEEIGSGTRCTEMRRARLRGFVAEEASEAERRVVQAHLLHCRACGAEVARMRGRLHELASGLFVLQAGGGPPGDLAARLLDAAGRGGEALIGSTRAARERLRELAIRASGGLPGSGGESAAGQIAGISGIKAATICAAGALTAGCLAAGIAPGLGGVEPARPTQGDHRAQTTRSAVPTPAAPSSQVETSPAPGESARARARASTEGRGRVRRPERSEPRVPGASGDRPTISGAQTGTEFGGEAAGAGAPAPAFSGGGGSGGGSAGEGSGSGGGPEFGL